jgi:hypothetical protein
VTLADDSADSVDRSAHLRRRTVLLKDASGRRQALTRKFLSLKGEAMRGPKRLGVSRVHLPGCVSVAG